MGLDMNGKLLPALLAIEMVAVDVDVVALFFSA